jgi:ABC-type uncharacterized transport system
MLRRTLNSLFRSGAQKRLLVGLLLVLSVVFFLSAMRYFQSEDSGAKPTLGLMTTLPLQWSEGGIEADLAKDAKAHPAYARLQQQYDVRPIDNFDTLDKDRVDVLVLAQPRALSPAELVKLDGWVRAGGRLVVFADPALQWGSLYPLGDKRRPLFTTMLSPLFAHWGLELVLPMTGQEAITLLEIDGLTLRTQTPGEWIEKAGESTGSCQILEHRIVADCKIGQGRALLVSDADLLDTVYWEGQGVRIVTGSDEFPNLQWVEKIILAIRTGKAVSGDSVGR